jgi:hypothetical protein
MTDFGRPLDHAEIEELLGAYALDAVDGAEREQIEQHLLTCPRCRAEVANHREVAALLAHGGAAAPDGVWDRIAAALEEPPPELRLTAAPPPAPPAPVAPPDPAAPVVPVVPLRRRWPRIAAAVVGVAAAVVIAVLAVHVRDLSDRLDRVPGDSALAIAANRALSEPGTRQAELRTGDGDLEALAVVTEDGQGFLLGQNLPELDDRVYQLWGVSGDQVVSLGVLGARPDVVAFSAGDTIEQFAVTAEVTPVEKTQNDPVVTGSFA